VEVQDGAVKRYYTARLLQGDEKQQWWERAVEAFPRYEQYRVKTKRDIPVFVLEPAE
jgi:deazaflavin-dependent oxidoreductase (nitroreductase family)